MAVRSLTTQVLAALLTALAAGCGGDSSSSSSSTASGASTSTGVFSAGPDLNTPRGQHTATLLRDGRVLVVGGTDGSGLIADAELFDPLTNSWDLVRHLNADDPAGGVMMDASGTFPTARQLHTATLLRDGRVLIAGGIGIERADATATPVLETLRGAYVFDPRTNRFTIAGPLAQARAWHEAIPTRNGALLVGGFDSNMRSLPTAELFDAERNTFTPIAMNGQHTWGSLVDLDGDALVVGGADVTQTTQGWSLPGAPAIGAEVFSEGAFTVGTPSSQNLVNRGSSATRGGAFFAGGQEITPNGLFPVTTTELYDAASGEFVAGPALTTARYGARVASIGNRDDRLVIGGIGSDGRALTSCEVWSASTNSILGTVTMITPRSDFQAVTLRDGRILVTGGLDGNVPVRALAQTEFHSR